MRIVATSSTRNPEQKANSNKYLWLRDFSSLNILIKMPLGRIVGNLFLTLVRGINFRFNSLLKQIDREI